MAQGPGTPELVAAVTRAGGLGVFGASGLTVERLERDIARARELAPDGPLGVNVQLAPPTPATGERARIVEVLKPFRRELGLPDEPPEPAAGRISGRARGGGARSRRLRDRNVRRPGAGGRGDARAPARICCRS